MPQTAHWQGRSPTSAGGSGRIGALQMQGGTVRLAPQTHRGNISRGLRKDWTISSAGGHVSPAPQTHTSGPCKVDAFEAMRSTLYPRAPGNPARMCLQANSTCFVLRAAAKTSCLAHSCTKAGELFSFKRADPSSPLPQIRQLRR